MKPFVERYELNSVEQSSIFNLIIMYINSSTALNKLRFLWWLYLKLSLVISHLYGLSSLCFIPRFCFIPSFNYLTINN